MKAIHAIVHGLVQGVSFRYHTRQQAGLLQLTGWVRNLPDGTVEVLAEGSDPALEQLARWLESGPSYSRVDRLDLSWTEASDDHQKFEITF